MPFAVSRRTLETLEWPRVLEALARHTRTPGGAAACTPPVGEANVDPTAWGFAPDDAAAAQWLAATGEARALLDAEHFPGLGGLPEVGTILDRLRREGVLTAPELLDLATTLGALTETRRFLDRRAAEAPRLAELGADLADLRELEETIHFHLDAEGQARDAASPVLADARRSARRLAGELQQRLARLLHDPDVAPCLSDSFYTVRNDRYVLPVRADARGRVRGVVHDASGSGTTLFIEPEPVLELNNRLRSAELEVERETRRILRALSHEAARFLPEMEASLAALVAVDLAFARGRFSQELCAVEPEVGRNGVFRLLQGRHPLLADDEVVPNDLVLGDAVHVLVLSGPNAGGKTVALKTVALAALLVRAGLQVPAAQGSRVDLVDTVLADIGDAQDMREHLSTFSAHLANLAVITRSADAGSLVVLDEVGVGTDPGEGAALAQAVLETLADRGARVVTTTHYNLLKEMAEVDARFENASVEFDPETGVPTYRLRRGAAGASSATTVAARMGLPAEVLDRTHALLEREDRRLDRMLAELSASRASLEAERREAEHLRAESEQARGEYRARLERLQERRDKLFETMRRDLDQAFRSAHADVAAVIRDLQRGGTAQAAAHARDRLLALEERARAVESAAAESAPKPEAPRTPVDWQRARPGDAVIVEGGGSGTLLALPDRRGRVAVQLGSARVQVPVDRVAPGTAPARPAPAPAPVAAGGSSRCDLRGLRVEEALGRLDEELDRAAASGRDRLVLVHGLGTGALRDAIRKRLAQSPYLETVRAGGPDEGGDGITIVDLG